MNAHTEVRPERVVLIRLLSTLASLPLSAAALASTEAPASYGVLAQAVAAAGALISAAGALTLCWKGRFNWEPAEEDVPRSAQKFGGLIIAIVIATMWYRFARQQSISADELIALAVGSAALGVGGLIVYSLLVGVFVYDKIVAMGGRKTGTSKMVGGFWLTADARASLKSGNPRPRSIAELFKGSGYDADLVWPRLSRALVKLSFQVSYVLLVAGGTCALAAVALVMAASA